MEAAVAEAVLLGELLSLPLLPSVLISSSSLLTLSALHRDRDSPQDHQLINRTVYLKKWYGKKNKNNFQSKLKCKYVSGLRTNLLPQRQVTVIPLIMMRCVFFCPHTSEWTSGTVCSRSLQGSCCPDPPPSDRSWTQMTAQFSADCSNNFFLLILLFYFQFFIPRCSKSRD